MRLVTLPNIGGGSDPATINVSVLNGKVDPLATEFNGGIDNENIASGAGIVYSKLSLTNGILNADINSAAAIVASKLDLSPVAQVIEMSGANIKFAKGSDIASATTTDIGAATGNYVHVTGTTTITGLGTVQAGTTILVRFTGALLLTHNATSLILPTAANITTVADDEAIFVSLGSGNWKCAHYSRKAGTALVGTAVAGQVIQVVNTTTTAVATGTTTLPVDDSIPQLSTDGTLFLSRAITPGATGNKLKITVVVNVAASAAVRIGCALFQDSTENALAAAATTPVSDTRICQISFVHYMTAGTISETTFKVHCGPTSAATLTFNGEGGAIFFGGVMSSSITVEEIKV